MDRVLRLSFFEDRAGVRKDRFGLVALCDTTCAYFDRFVISVCFTCASIGSIVSERTMSYHSSAIESEKGKENEQ
jgi:hypothetical protein